MKRPDDRGAQMRTTGLETVVGAMQAMPPCALCGHSGGGPRAERYLSHGVSVWLCGVHGGDAFLMRRGGAEFVERLAGVWAAAGVTGARRTAALQAHLRRLDPTTGTRQRPGSYAWAALRRHAEGRFAAGEPPNAVIADLRRAHQDGPATLPSVRTMRRWFSEARPPV